MTKPAAERRPWVLWPGLLVSLGAVAATAHGLYEVATAAKVPGGIAWLYPIITDGLALVAYASTARLTGAGRSYAWWVVILSAGLSGLAQAAYLAGGVKTAPPELGFGVGAWPAIAAAIAAHLLFLIDAEHRRRLAEAAERARRETEARQREEARREEVERRRVERGTATADRTSTGASTSSRNRGKKTTRTATEPNAKPAGTATPKAPVPDAGTGTAGAVPDAADTASTPRLHIVENRNDSEPSPAGPAASWTSTEWTAAVDLAREYRTEHGSDVTLNEVQTRLGINRNRASVLRRAVLASREVGTGDQDDSVPGANEVSP